MLELRQLPQSQAVAGQKLLGKGLQYTFYSHHSRGIRLPADKVVRSNTSHPDLGQGERVSVFICFVWGWIWQNYLYKFLSKPIAKDTEKRKEITFPPFPSIGYLIFLTCREKIDLRWEKRMYKINQGLWGTWLMALTRCKREVKQ